MVSCRNASSSCFAPDSLVLGRDGDAKVSKFLFYIPVCFYFKCKVQNKELVRKRKLEKCKGRYEFTTHSVLTPHRLRLRLWSEGTTLHKGTSVSD